MSESIPYAIIGGGIAGASIAYHLSEETDEKIVVFERRTPGSETTAKSHAHVTWKNGEPQLSMKRYALRMYNEFFQSSSIDSKFQLLGRLVVTTSSEGAKLLDPNQAVDRSTVDPSLLKRFDVYIPENEPQTAVEYIPGTDLKEQMMVPYLATDSVEGALYRPRLGYFTNPRALANEFLKRAKANGAVVRSQTEVTEIHRDGDAVTGIRTSANEEYRTDHVICAAGPWNVTLADQIGLDLPLRHNLAPVINLRPSRELSHTIPSTKDMETGCSIRGVAEDGTILVNYREPGGYDEATEYEPGTVSDDVPDHIKRKQRTSLENLMPSLPETEIVDEWVGIRSVTPDHDPIVGWTDIEGLSIAAFSTSGIQLAPATGYVIANQLVHDDPTSYYDDLSISRFDGCTDIHGGAPR